MSNDVSNALDWTGRTLVDGDGDRIGTIDQIYVDNDTEQPEWATVTTGLFGTKASFVPLAQASQDGDAVLVPYAKQQVKDAPRVDADQALSQEEEAALYRHYGLSYSEQSSDSGLPDTGTPRGDSDGDTVGRDVSGPTTDDAMTRSEEELRVGTTSREAGRARLRKYVTTETVTQTVPVQREEVRLEREPITDANVGDATTGPDISEEEHEVVLHAEEPVVEKRTVPKERVRLDTETVTGEETISDEVRKEHIDTDDSALRR